MRARSTRASFLLTALLATAGARPGTARADTGTDLVADARMEEARHHDDVALARYHEAIQLDPSLESAYVGLADLRTRHGDLHEAERVLSLALARMPTAIAALRARAHVRRKLGLRQEATEDLAAYAGATGDPAATKELVTWYTSDAQFPRALAVVRAIREAARARGDAAGERDAKAWVRALQTVVDGADPVLAPEATKGSRFRAMVARVARRSG